MTELERLLKSTLTTLGQEFAVTQETHGVALTSLQSGLETHNQIIHRLKKDISQLQTQQIESAQRLQRLSDIYASLGPLLSRLNDLLGGTWNGQEGEE